MMSSTNHSTSSHSTSSGSSISLPSSGETSPWPKSSSSSGKEFSSASDETQNIVFKKPPYRTQVQTSSSSNSSETKTISTSIDECRPNASYVGSQDLFTLEPTITSTPFLSATASKCSKDVSLQLSGNSQPTPAEIPKFSLTSSSSEEESQRLDSLALPTWCEKQFQATSDEQQSIKVEKSIDQDNEASKSPPVEHKPAYELSINENDDKKERALSVMSNEETDSPAIPQMDFELSQDFSQFKEPITITKVKVQGQNTSDSLKEKKLLSQPEFQEIIGKCPQQFLIDYFNSYLRQHYNINDNFDKIVEFYKKHLGKEKATVPMTHVAEKVKEVKPEYEVGSQVFALWVDRYYPGTIMQTCLSKVFVEFDDKTKSWLAFEDTFLQSDLPTNQQVSVCLDDEFYYDGMLNAVKRDETGSPTYEVQMAGEESIKHVKVSSLCLTEEQKNSFIPSSFSTTRKEKVLVHKQKSLKRCAPISDSSSTTEGTEVTFTRKKKRITVENVLLFTDFSFLITTDPANSYHHVIGECLSPEESQNLDVNNLKKMILNNGGNIIPSLNQREIRKTKNLLCISTQVLNSIKYLYCVVSGIPILHYQWVYKSIENNARQNYGSYKLPAGIDITGQYIEQLIGNREPYRPLLLQEIYFYVGKSKNFDNSKSKNRDLNALLHLVGCDRVFENFNLTSRTKKLPFPIHNIVLICTLTDKVPSVLRNAADSKKIPIVTGHWLTQCLINNKLLEFEDSRIFMYKHEINNSPITEALTLTTATSSPTATTSCPTIPPNTTASTSSPSITAASPTITTASSTITAASSIDTINETDTMPL